MNRKTHKILAAALAVLMTAAISFAGCTQNSSAKKDAGGNKVTWWCQFYPAYSQMYENYSEVPFYQELQKRTDVEIEFIHPTVGQESEAFGLLMAARDYPDIFPSTFYKGGAEGALSDGVAVDLKETIETGAAPYIQKTFREHPEWDKMVRTSDGKYPGFPYMSTDPSLGSWQGLQIRQDYLDRVNLEKPETISEWETVLTAFRDQLGVEYPMSMLSMDVLAKAMSGAFSTYNDYYLKDGKVVYGPAEPEYKEFLTTMKDWYGKKLLDQDFGTQDEKTFRAKVASGQTGAYFHSVGGGMGTFAATVKENDPNGKLAAVKFPVLNKGDEPRFGFWSLLYNGTVECISSSCKNFGAAVRLLDYGYSDEGKLLWNFGIEGKSYEMKDGLPYYTDDMLNNPDGLPAAQALLQYCHGPLGAPLHDPRYFEQYMPLPEQKEAPSIWTLSDVDWMLPYSPLTPEEVSRTSSKLSEIKTYVEEMSLKYIMGIEDFSSYESYLEKLNTLGLQEVIKAKQAAQDRYASR